MAAESRKRQARVAFTVVFVAGTPAAAQRVTTAPAPDSAAALPPATVAKGPALPPALVLNLRRQVRDAVARTRAHAVVGAEAPRPQPCDVRGVGIELVSGDAPGSAIAATVAGQVRTRAAARTRGPVVTSVRFALLYVYTGEVWRLTLAKYRPEAPASRATREPAWQDLWSDGPESRDQAGCLVAGVWHHLGAS